MTTFIATSQQHETISHLAWRIYGRRLPHMVEQILALNKHLSSLPAALPADTSVRMPNRPPKSPTIRPSIQLWD